MLSEPGIMTFRGLFRGREDAWGINRGGVERGELTLNQYGDHLGGIEPLGIFPMLDSNEVWFCAIDLDEPDFELAQKMQRLIPGESWIERSRSGNAHVWAFFARQAPAWAVRAVLRSATEAVGRPDVEIFPKQDQLREGMVGNYINLPLFGNERPILQFFNGGFEACPRGEALAGMARSTQEPAVWENRARLLGAAPPQEREQAAEFGEQETLHECAWYIIDGRHERPLERGHRHVVLFNLAKMLLNCREIERDRALQEVLDVNDAGEAPLPRREVTRMFDNALAGRFTSTGCDDPVMAPYVSPACTIVHRHG